MNVMRERWRGWSTKRKVGVVASAAALMLGAGVAIALTLLRSDLDGGGQVVARPTLDFTAVGTPTFTDMSDCTAVFDPATKAVNVQLVESFQGGICTVPAMVVRNGAGGDFKVQGIHFSTTTDDFIAAADCGKLLPSGEVVSWRVRFR